MQSVGARAGGSKSWKIVFPQQQTRRPVQQLGVKAASGAESCGNGNALGNAKSPAKLDRCRRGAVGRGERTRARNASKPVGTQPPEAARARSRGSGRPSTPPRPGSRLGSSLPSAGSQPAQYQYYYLLPCQYHRRPPSLTICHGIGIACDLLRGARLLDCFAPLLHVGGAPAAVPT